ncbi:MAG: hypothetical protein NTV34_15595 [Proteobacteria bacterium]|nr:hypothetical protein [Pseudomonadota bacterium]
MNVNSQIIGIIRTSSIGDVVLASACLDLASRLGVQVVWFGRGPAMQLLRASFPEVFFVELPVKFRGLNLRDLYPGIDKLKVCVDLQGNGRSKAFGRFIKGNGIQVILADKARLRRWVLIGAAYLRRRMFPLKKPEGAAISRQYQTMVSAFAQGLCALGLSRMDVEREQALARPNLRGLVKTSAENAWGKELRFGRWISLAPGAAHDTKRCPKSFWLELLACFNDPKYSHKEIGLIMVGGEADRKIAVEILDEIFWSGPILNLVGKLTLEETAAALSQAEILLTNDSGLLHIAEAVGTDVLAVFGPTIETFGFSPWRERSIVASSQVGCRPCSRHGKMACRYSDKLCFETVSLVDAKRKLEEVFMLRVTPVASIREPV